MGTRLTVNIQWLINYHASCRDVEIKNTDRLTVYIRVHGNDASHFPVPGLYRLLSALMQEWRGSDQKLDPGKASWEL